MTDYDVIVVGGGHAGCEAALAAARLGTDVCLVTMNHREVACMPCNPAVGGIAKSHLVFELDALGGEIARNTDYAGIQFRTLNTKKGPAVQANRAQCDKSLYSARMAQVLQQCERLTLTESTVAEIWTAAGKLRGVVLADGTRLAALAVVVTAGTFLRGSIHIGKKQRPGGRDDAPSADSLSISLQALGLRMARLKTGTPPRLHASSLDYSRMEPQDGEMPPPFFSWSAQRHSEMFHVEHRAVSPATRGACQPNMNAVGQPTHFLRDRIPLDLRLALGLLPGDNRPGLNPLRCFLTHTTAATHALITDNLERSALYGGGIVGTGVRYCPSIEDKVVKFSDKPSHHVFIEPEGRHTELIYPNGISNSLPEDVQEDLVHSIPGLEHAEILKWAYAIEYDFVDPTQLSHSLETLHLAGLYCAGQVNGTTGYEEAAAQGFMAGVNAARKVRGEAPLVLQRQEAYIGVLIDDLVTKGTDEPYRMFTSRAEHRLLLRQDNANLRMLPHAESLGIVPAEQLLYTESIRAQIDTELTRLTTLRCAGATHEELLRRPEIAYADLPSPNPDLKPEAVRQIEIQVKYGGYIERERRVIKQALARTSVTIPVDFDYWSVSALRYEAREKLSRIRPENLGQASRVPGVTPADISILTVMLKR